jgi:DNA-binding GntR family transcriptional regulator
LHGRRDDTYCLRDNRDFHVEIARASGNERMARILASLLDEMERLLHLGLFSRREADRLRIDHELQRRDHAALVDALSAGDQDGAEKAARQHIEHSRELVTSAVLNGMFSANL